MVSVFLLEGGDRVKVREGTVMEEWRSETVLERSSFEGTLPLALITESHSQGVKMASRSWKRQGDWLIRRFSRRNGVLATTVFRTSDLQNSKVIYLCYKPQKLWFMTAATDTQYRFSHGLETRDNGLEWALQTKTLPLNLHFFSPLSAAVLPLTPNFPSQECPLIILLHI